MECAPGRCPTLRGGAKHCENNAIQTKAFPATEVGSAILCARRGVVALSAEFASRRPAFELMLLHTDRCVDACSGRMVADGLSFASLYLSCPGPQIDQKQYSCFVRQSFFLARLLSLGAEAFMFVVSLGARFFVPSRAEAGGCDCRTRGGPQLAPCFTSTSER